MHMNVYRQLMIMQRQESKGAPKICVKCAGWSSFGNVHTPMYIALYGDICCCNEHWYKLNAVLDQNKSMASVPTRSTS